MRSYRLESWFGCLFILFFWVAPVYSVQETADLPPESALPGRTSAQEVRPIVAEPPPAVKPELPGESTLPSEATLPVSVPVVQDPRKKDPSPATTTDSPSPKPEESSSAQEQAPDEKPERKAVEDQLLQLDRSEDKRPWLRLRQNAHVDRVRTIAFSSDSTRLFVGGDDKHILFHRLADDGTWNYERTVRWQIQRGASGRIYSLASTPGMLAMGGRSATGSVGELLLFHPETGKLLEVLVGDQAWHDDRVTSLAFSQEPKNPSLVSMDQRGCLLQWKQNPETGLWFATQLEAGERAEELLYHRTLHPVAAINRRYTAAPVPAGVTSQGQPRWRVKFYDAQDATKHRLLMQNEQYHVGLVSAMAASAKGALLASADESGQLFLWDLTKSAVPVRHQLRGIPTALSFSHDGKTLAIGTSGPSHTVQLWDLDDLRVRRLIREDTAADDVLACAMSPDGRYVAFSQGGDVVVRNVGRRVQQEKLVRSSILQPTRVAFASFQDPSYKIAFSTKPGAFPALETVFDPVEGQLGNEAVQPNAWLTGAEHQQDWSVKVDSQQTWLEQGGQRRAQIPLNPALHGAFKTACWIPREGRPYAVAIGTYATEIYVYELRNTGQCRLLRKFRGHTGATNSMCVSVDGRYLVSCSSDRTIRVWNLEGLGTDPSVDRWGATLEVQDGKVTAGTIRKEGPLYFRGVRQGDEITSLTWRKADQEATAANEPEAILNRFRQGSPDELTAFYFRRGRAVQSTFQSFPAWQPLATLIVDQSREWAFWTPAGYYDASFEGHKLFGWQVNRGQDVEPDFFLAAQVRATLERPEIMARLLPAGSLADAFAGQNAAEPANWSSVLAHQQSLRPRITILEPQSGVNVNGSSIRVVAKIEVNKGQQLVSPRAFANGIASARPSLVRRVDTGSKLEFHYQWSVPAPSDPELLIQVAAATGEESADMAEVRVRRGQPQPRSAARMFVVALGINNYSDARVPRLQFAVANAQQVAQTLNEEAFPVYDCEATTLVDERANRATWRVSMETYAETLRQEATPDDLLVLYLSGHGVRDDRTGQYYYLPANVKYDDVSEGRFEDCMSFEDLSLFGEVPCRKLIILDTCHSGAIQTLRQRELKSAIRALQDDIFLILTASEGGQLAAEDGQKGMGRFTYRLLEAVRGAADQLEGNKDGIVSLDELVRYVQTTVQQDSAGTATIQYPMAGPMELIQLTKLPIAASQKPAGG